MIDREYNRKSLPYFPGHSSLERFQLKYKERFEQLTPEEVKFWGLLLTTWI